MTTASRAALAVAIALSLTGSAHAQGDVVSGAIVEVGVPDLTELFRARPPMGDCPVGGSGAAGAEQARSAHVLHLGVTRFYLNQRGRLQLSRTQVADLKRGRSAALDLWWRQQAALDALEVLLWEQTGSAEPDLLEVGHTVADIERTRAAQRTDYIGAVLKASRVLSEEQRAILVTRPQSEERRRSAGPTDPDAQWGGI